MQPITPRGFRDALPQEAAEREAISSALSSVFDAWSYERVETPAVEEYAVLAAGSGRSLEGSVFRLFDSDGRLLALRPEMTVPIARLVATRLREVPPPYRVRYVADVFREQGSMRGQARQFTQAGVEIVGASGPAADAEIVSVLAEALDATGLARFTIALGTVAVLRGLLEASRGEERWRDAVLAAAHERNLVEIDRLTFAGGIDPSVAEALRAVCRIRGGREAIQACRAATAACGCASVLDEFEAMWELLEATGAAARVTVDFSVMRAFDYYTGVVFEVFTPGFGLPVGGGGRYDAVLSAFGAPMPAAGFALGIDRLHIALAEQGVLTRVSPLDAVVCGPDPAAVLVSASALRRAGWRVRVAPGVSGREAVRAGQDAGARDVLLADGGGLVRLNADGTFGEPLSAIDDGGRR